MALLNGAELARKVGVSRNAVSKLFKKGSLVRVNELFDTEHPTNAAYIRYHKKLKGSPPASKKRAASKKKTTKKDIAKKQTTKKTIPVKQPPKKKNPDTNNNIELDLSEIDDMNSLGRADLERLKIISAIETARVKTDEKRSHLIPRELVERVFGKLYSIDANEFKNLGMNLSPAIAAITENDSPKITALINEAIDKEAYSILSNIKRKINDFLEDVGAEKII